MLVLGTALILIQADFTDPFCNPVFLKGTSYKLFSIVLDLSGLLCIAMLAGLFVRRYVIRPEGLETGNNDALMHGLLRARAKIISPFRRPDLGQICLI